MQKLLAYRNTEGLHLRRRRQLSAQQLVSDKIRIHAVANPPAVNREIRHDCAEPQRMLLLIIADNTGRSGVRCHDSVGVHLIDIAASQRRQQPVQQASQPKRAALLIAPAVRQLVEPRTAFQYPQIGTQKRRT